MKTWEYEVKKAGCRHSQVKPHDTVSSWENGVKIEI